MSELRVDTVNESTTDAGVTVDGVLLKDGAIEVDAIEEATADTGVTIDGVLLKDGRAVEARYQPTYGTTIAIDAQIGPLVKITVTDGVGFTISNPTNLVAGQRLLFDIVNSSGGAMGTITWDTMYLLAGSFTNPADTTRRTIEFYYDGTDLVEVCRAAADI